MQTRPPDPEMRKPSPQAVAATDLPRKANPVNRASFPDIALGRGVGAKQNPVAHVRPEPDVDPATDALEHAHAVNSVHRRVAEKLAAVRDGLVNTELKAPGGHFVNAKGEAWYAFSSPALHKEAQALVGREITRAEANKRVAERATEGYAQAIKDWGAAVEAATLRPLATFEKGRVGTLPLVTVERVIDDETAIVRVGGLGDDPRDCWLVTDTSGWAGGDVRAVEGAFRVTGEKRPVTVLGADRTIPLVESTDPPQSPPEPKRPRVRLPYPVEPVSWDIQFAGAGVLTAEVTGDSKYWAAIQARSTYADLKDDGFGHNVYGGVVVALLNTDLRAYQDAWVDGDHKKMARMREGGIVWVTKETVRVRYEYTKDGLAYVRIDGGLFDRRLVAVEARYVK
jgi:hypothetical protein